MASSKKDKRSSSQLRALRTQRIVATVIAILVVLSMIVSLFMTY
jgi:hypothetical protein